MKKSLAKRLGLPGKAFLTLFALVAGIFTAQSTAQTKGCVKADFDFAVDNSTNTVKFEARTSSNALLVVWDFGDGDSARGKNVKHKYDTTGYYKVCLTAYAYDSAKKTRCSTTVCKRVVVSGCTLKADFDFKVSDLSVALEGKSNSKNAVYGWAFGDGNYGRGKTTKHTFKKEDTYTICVIVKDTVTGCVSRACKKVKVEDPCNLKVDFDLRKDDLSVKLEAKSNSKTTVYGWTFGDGNSARGQQVKHTYKKEGKYTICLIAKDTATGCVARKCVDVKVEDSCTLRVDFDLRKDGLDIKVAGKSNSKTTVYGWTFGDGNSARGQEVKHSYKKEGKYTVCLIAKDTVTGCVARKCVEIKVEKPCKLEVDFEYRQDGNDFKFRAKASDTSTRFAWSFGDGTTATGKEVKHSYKKPGVYTVCVKAYSKSGCKTEKCKRVEIKRDTCSLQADFKFEVDGKKIRVKAKANESDVLYYWSWGDGTSEHGQTARHRYKKYGVYEVCLIVFNPKTKCKVCICKKVVIEKPCRLRADFRYGVNNSTVRFKARSNSKNTVYGWVFGDGSSQRGNPVKHTYAKPGVYKITLIAKDTATGCVVTVEKRIIINPKARKSSLAPLPPTSQTSSSSATSSVQELSVPDNDWTATVYPVPSANQVGFTANKTLNSVTIYNASGNEILSSELKQNERIDISTLPTGYYFAHVTALDGSVKIVKFAKN
ncbi:MAG: PKD domain-containing protein [Bacteroidia bacterium]|nr:PKD domain-containing protein [Bacteroidia bacterium]